MSEAKVRDMSIRKRSVTFDGKKTSVSLEDEFWDSLAAISEVAQVERTVLLKQITKGAPSDNRSSAIRVFCCSYWRNIALAGKLERPGLIQ